MLAYLHADRVLEKPRKSCKNINQKSRPAKHGKLPAAFERPWK